MVDDVRGRSGWSAERQGRGGADPAPPSFAPMTAKPTLSRPQAYTATAAAPAHDASTRGPASARTGGAPPARVAAGPGAATATGADERARRPRTTAVPTATRTSSRTADTGRVHHLRRRTLWRKP